LSKIRTLISVREWGGWWRRASSMTDYNDPPQGAVRAFLFSCLLSRIDLTSLESRLSWQLDLIREGAYSLVPSQNTRERWFDCHRTRGVIQFGQNKDSRFRDQGK
jgi:hypothetical protein